MSPIFLKQQLPSHLKTQVDDSYWIRTQNSKLKKDLSIQPTSFLEQCKTLSQDLK